MNNPLSHKTRATGGSGGKGGSGSAGNVNVKIGSTEGIYAGSATNMARLFIMCNVIWAILFAVFAYAKGVESGNLENRVAVLESYHK